MTQAIGPSTAAASVTAGAPAAGLEAQLARYQKQLSECVNCASSRTPEGKAEIQEISGRINEIRERIDRVTDANIKASVETTRLAGSASTKPGANGNATAMNDDANAARFAVQRSAYATVGSVVDVRA